MTAQEWIDFLTKYLKANPTKKNDLIIKMKKNKNNQIVLESNEQD